MILKLDFMTFSVLGHELEKRSGFSTTGVAQLL
jgi:hypothetical protein